MVFVEKFWPKTLMIDSGETVLTLGNKLAPTIPPLLIIGGAPPVPGVRLTTKASRSPWDVKFATPTPGSRSAVPVNRPAT